jgi:Malectin domain
VATGHYLPKFVDRATKATYPIAALDAVFDDGAAAEAESGLTRRRAAPIWYWLLGGICLGLLVIVGVHRLRHLTANSANVAAAVPPPVLGPEDEVRIRCGYNRALFRDEGGNIWSGDRYFSGGAISELRNQYIARTRDPELYLTARSGTFSYKLPLKPGTYELRLHFAETTYTPASTLGGGENSRVFNVRLNGRPLLNAFDVVADAGANTADVRVFKDVQPGPDGTVQLDFSGVLGVPMINAIEIVPGLQHRLRPIRMVTQNSFFVDKAGNLWSPDTYFAGGQLAVGKVPVTGTDDPGLYAGERYGNFSYALPVDQGSYSITLYFAEKYWGTNFSKEGGVGSRVFDVLCNGTALVRNLDIVKEAGPGHAYQKTFHGLHPNAQGKLLVSLVPDTNYATVDAIKVEEETR